MNATIRLALALGAVSYLFGTARAVAQYAVTEVDTVRRVGTTENDDFGFRVELEGTRLMAAAHLADSVGTDSGDVQVFRLNGTPSVEGVLVGGDVRAGDRFGFSAAMDEDQIVVGAPGHDHGVGGAGAAYVFRWSGSAWVEEAELLASRRESDDEFGWAVAVAGDTVVVGARKSDPGGAVDQGAFFVFERVGGAWVEVQEGGGQDSVAGDWLGAAVATDGDWIAVAAASASAGYPYSGAVYLFREVGGAWVQQQKLAPGVDHGTFGHALDLDGDLLAVGMPYGDGTGVLYVYRELGGTWMEEALLRATYGTTLDQLGTSVQVASDRLVVGALFESIWGQFSGAAHVFDWTGGTWTERLRLIPSQGAGDGYFGAAVSLDGDRVAVGAPTFPNGEPYLERVFLYELPEPIGERFCLGDGSGTPCPCGNESQSGLAVGCENAYGWGASLDAAGSASVSADDLTLSVSYTVHTPSAPPSGEPILLVVGDGVVNGGLGIGFGDGLRCIDGGIVRLGVEFGTPFRGIAIWGPGLSPLGGWSAGDTRYFHAWYRDPWGTPCGSGFNTSNALEIDFAP